MPLQLVKGVGRDGFLERVNRFRQLDVQQGDQIEQALSEPDHPAERDTKDGRRDMDLAGWGAEQENQDGAGEAEQTHPDAVCNSHKISIRRCQWHRQVAQVYTIPV